MSLLSSARRGALLPPSPGINRVAVLILPERWNSVVLTGLDTGRGRNGTVAESSATWRYYLLNAAAFFCLTPSRRRITNTIFNPLPVAIN